MHACGCIHGDSTAVREYDVTFLAQSSGVCHRFSAVFQPADSRHGASEQKTRDPAGKMGCQAFRAALSGCGKTGDIACRFELTGFSP